LLPLPLPMFPQPVAVVADVMSLPSVVVDSTYPTYPEQIVGFLCLRHPEPGVDFRFRKYPAQVASGGYFSAAVFYFYLYPDLFLSLPY
jgi:hypothetical protein